MSTIDTKSPIVHQDEFKKKKKANQSLNQIAEPRGRRNAAAYQLQYRKTFVAQQQSTGQNQLIISRKLPQTQSRCVEKYLEPAEWCRKTPDSVTKMYLDEGNAFGEGWQQYWTRSQGCWSKDHLGNGRTARFECYGQTLASWRNERIEMQEWSYNMFGNVYI